MNDAPVRPEHPAKFSKPIIDHIATMVSKEMAHKRLQRAMVLDPMAGVGGIHRLREIVPGAETIGLEIEPEWAEQSPWTRVGDATAMTFEGGTVPIIAFSPPYGNRMADQFVSKDGTRRITYYHMLGRRLDDNSAAGLHFGPEYQALMHDIYVECKRVLRQGGLLILNVSDFIRAGDVVPVVEWHVDDLLALGFQVEYRERITTRRMKFGANHKLRVDYEEVIGFRSPIRR